MAHTSDLELPEVKAAGKAAYRVLKSEDPSYCLSGEGDGVLLGGSLVCSARFGEVIFMHRERVFGDTADPKALLDACRGVSQKARL